MYTERDAVRADGTFNWRVICEIATYRALAERDIDIIERVHGAPLKKPAGVSTDNLAKWRGQLADKLRADHPTIEITPYITLYRREMRSVCASARAVRFAMQQRAELTSGKVIPFSVAPRVRLINQLLGSMGSAS